MLEKISRVLLFGAVASIFIRRGLFHPYILQPFEILILASSLLLIIHFIKNGIKEETRKDLLYWGKLLSIFILLFGISLIFTILSQDVNHKIAIGILKDYFILFCNSLGFLLIIYFKNSLLFIKNSLKSFLTPLLFGIFILFPSLILFINVTEGYGSLFLGFYNSRTAFGNFLIIPFSILLAYFVRNRNIYKKAMGFVGLTIIVALMLWTSARNAYLAIILIPGFIFFLSILERKKIIWFFKFSLAIIATIFIAYIILPQEAKNTAIIRVFPQYSNLSDLSNFSDKELKEIGITKNIFISSQKSNSRFFGVGKLVKVPSIDNQSLLKIVLKNPRPETNVNSRVEIWKNAFPLFLKNPLGLSTQFYNISKSIKDGVGGFIAGSHNTFLQIGLSGGWIALVLFLLFLYKVFKSLKESKNDSWVWLALAGANFGMLAMLLFDDRLFNPWVWIIASLAIAYAYTQEKNDRYSYDPASCSKNFL